MSDRPDVEAEQAYREAEANVEAQLRHEQHDWEWEQLVAAGFVKLTPREAKLLTSVGGSPGSNVRMVAEDLLPDGQVVLLCAEEGTGKTWLAHQIAAELVAGVPVLGTFAVPEPVKTVLIVDVEQTEEDVRIVRDEMMRRGVLTPNAQVYWLDAGDRALDTKEDMTWLIQQIAVYRPDVLVIDTLTDSVTNPLDDQVVRGVFRMLKWLVTDGGVRVIIGLAQPRKTGQSRDAQSRSFDSLFGSRAWKSKPSAVFWMTETKLIVWKQRGQYLRKRWGKVEGKRNAEGSLQRKEDGPPVVAGPPIDEADATDAKVIAAILAKPGMTAKDDVAKAAGVKATAGRASIDRLVDRGEVVRDGPGTDTPGYRVVEEPRFD
jgi:hypothetical protein